jgi:DNA-binding HxlR family transcriptional regulator
MGNYRQYCPISRASEILAERWNPLIVRNLMFGAETFSDLARGVPAMSRSMLIKRLQELDRDGIIERRPKPEGHGHLYRLTDAGADLADVIDSLGAWGERWVEVTTEHADPGFALWAWCQVQLDRKALPRARTVVAFEFPQEPPGNRYYWLLAERGDAELCYSDPGDDPDLYVRAESLAFVDWHRGRLDWIDALQAERIEVIGSRSVAKALPTWNTHVPLTQPVS